MINMGEKFCRVVDKIEEIEEKTIGPLDTISVISDPDHSKKHRKIEIETMEDIKEKVLTEERFSDGLYVIVIKNKSWKPNGWCQNYWGDKCEDGYTRNHRMDWEYKIEAEVYEIKG